MSFGQKRAFSDRMDDSSAMNRSRFSTFDSKFKRRRHVPSVSTPLVVPESVPVSFASRVASALSGKLLPGVVLNPRPSHANSSKASLDLSRNDASMHTSFTGPLRTSLRASLHDSGAFDTSRLSDSFHRNGFAIIGSHSVGLKAHKPPSPSPDVMRLKMALLQNYKNSLAERERLLTDEFDAESKKLLEERKKADSKEEDQLTPDQRELVQRYFAAANQKPRDVVVDAYRIELTYSDLATLRPGKWLNDNVMDMYLNTVTEENPNVFTFTTHFFSRLEEDGYGAVKRWAMRKKLDVFVPDQVFVPVNRGNLHWTLAVIDNKNKKLVFYDSLPSGRGQAELELLVTYLEGEAKRLGRPGIPQYELVPHGKGPSQANGSDCGVFVCEAITRLASGRPLSHTQSSMRAVRERIAYKLISLRNNSKL